MKTASVSLGMVAVVWQERIERASGRFGMLAGVRQEPMKRASVSLGMLAGVCQEPMKTSNAPNHSCCHQGCSEPMGCQLRLRGSRARERLSPACHTAVALKPAFATQLWVHFLGSVSQRKTISSSRASPVRASCSSLQPQFGAAGFVLQAVSPQRGLSGTWLLGSKNEAAIWLNFLDLFFVLPIKI